jgi:DNA-binding GntR family transcriptional regulator
MISAIEAAKALGVSVPTARAALQNLHQLGIVKDISGKGKERIYVYTELLMLLEQGVGRNT